MIKISENSEGRNIGFEISEKVTIEELEPVIMHFENAVKKYKTVNWICIINNFKGFTFKAMFRDLFFNVKNIRNFKRKAVVADEIWIKVAVCFFGFLFGIRYYDVSNIEEAWNYIKS